MYEYEATVLRVVDGDTFDLMVDLGLSTHVRVRVRLNRVNAWETRGPERQKGLRAARFVRKLMPRRSKVRIKTIKLKSGMEMKGKYGRYVADVTLKDGRDLADLLVQKKHARYQKYT